MLKCKSIEITTIVGCKNMCSYCPQRNFLKNYDSNIRIITLDKFKYLLSLLDKDIILCFAGFCENFTNKEFVDMLIYSKENNFKIELFTTLTDCSIEDINRLKENNVNFKLVSFHVFDSKLFNKDEFDSKTNYFKEYIFSKEYNYYNPKDWTFSRASNNNIDIQYKSVPLYCDFFNYSRIYNNNVLLPNGDVYLCSMDWSLKHKIGNIFINSYDSVEFNSKRIEIENSILLNDSNDICRKCEFSKNKY